MATSILGVIQHYQRSIDQSQDDEGRLLHCINKLYKLPIKVEHLQETGIGKTVNSLRKYSGEIGVAAKALVTKWKAMVAAEEEEPVEAHCQSNEDVAASSNGRESSDDDRSQHPSHNNAPLAAAPQPPSDYRPSSSTMTEKDKHHKERNSRKEGESPSSSERHSSKSKHHKSDKSSVNSNSHKHSSRHRSPLKSRDQAASTEQNERPRQRQGDEGSREKDKNKHRSRSEKHALQEEQLSSGGSSGEAKPQQQQQEQKNGEVRDKSNKQRISDKHSSSTEKEKHVSEKPKDHKHNRSKSSSNEHEKSRSKEKEHRSKHKSASQASSTKPQTSTSGTPNAKSDQKRHHSALDSDNDEATPKAKVAKTQKNVKHKNMEVDGNGGEAEPEDGIDSSMGANFADVLGMLNMPSKKSKKASSALKSPTSSVPKQATAGSSSSKSSSSRHDNVRSTVNNASTSASASLSQSASTSATATYKRSPPDLKPALLTSAAKLEPLDPSIVFELPTISTNYKPLPVNQTVMDCIFNNSSAASTPKPPPPVRTLTDAEALSHSISSKTMRTKIYSGVKTGQIHQVPLLFDLCIRVLQKNIDALEYTGGVPFEVLRPVLERATPQQLLTFEDYNPYLMEDSDVLWRLHVQRTYRIKKRQEMESWREMFLRCQEEEERKLNTLTESIKQSQKIIAAPVRKTQLAFVDSMVKPPRNVLRKQEQYGTKAKPIATPASRVPALSSVTPNAAKVGDLRLRVAPTARDTAQVSHTGVRPKKAPLMAKTLQFMRGRHKR